MISEASLHSYSSFLENSRQLSLVFLIGFGFLGGLLSSVLPCVISLLPVNLAYIGTLKINDKFEAFKKAGAFVLGASLVLTMLGLFDNLVFAVFNEYKGIINFIIGLIIVLMALNMLGLFKIEMPNFMKKVPDSSPFVIGMAFALVSSPCSSPVLVSVLSIAASLKSVFESTIMMFAFSLGYTAIIFFASLSTGLVKQMNFFKSHSSEVVKISAAVLGLIGLFYIYIGLRNMAGFY